MKKIIILVISIMLMLQISYCEENKLKVSGTIANIQKENNSPQVIAQLPGETELELVEKNGNWMKVRFEDGEGWIIPLLLINKLHRSK